MGFPKFPEKIAGKGTCDGFHVQKSGDGPLRFGICRIHLSGGIDSFTDVQQLFGKEDLSVVVRLYQHESRSFKLTHKALDNTTAEQTLFRRFYMHQTKTFFCWLMLGLLTLSVCADEQESGRKW